MEILSRSMLYTLLIVVSFQFNSHAHGQLSADDFLSPANASTPADKMASREVKQPEALVESTDTATGEPMIEAATQQDAVNAGLKELAGTGCQMLNSPSGRAWVACGVANYRAMENVTATRISKREAYVAALMGAKRELATTLRGLKVESKTAIKDEVATLNTETDTLSNLASSGMESIDTFIESVLRGYIIYDVEDDITLNQVRVSIVTSPKTRGEVQRPSSNSLEATTLKEGLEQVFGEINSGLVPPVGGKIVSVTATGELAFIGFGSAVINSDENAAVQSKLRLNAQRIADVRSKDALAAIVLGEKFSAKSSSQSGVVSEIKDFDMLEENDPLAQSTGGSLQELNERLETFKAAESHQEELTSIRSGMLPPGIAQKSFTDAEGAWVYSVAVYIPSLSNAAGADADAMEHAQIVKPADSGKRLDSKKASGSGFSDGDNENVPRPVGADGQGPTGRVGSEF